MNGLQPGGSINLNRWEIHLQQVKSFMACETALSLKEALIKEGTVSENHVVVGPYEAFFNGNAWQVIRAPYNSKRIPLEWDAGKVADAFATDTVRDSAGAALKADYYANTPSGSFGLTNNSARELIAQKGESAAIEIAQITFLIAFKDYIPG
jgi:hypothetical protein